MTRLAAELYTAALLAVYVASAGLIFFIRGQSAMPPVVAAFAVVAVLVAVAAVRPPRRLAPIAATVLLCLAAAARADALPALLAAGVIGLAAHATGAVILRPILGRAAIPRLEAAAYEIAIGLAVLAYAVFVLGLLGWLTPVPVGALFAAVIVVFGRRTVAELRGALPSLRTATEGPATVALVVGCVWTVLLFVEALAPELQYDSLSYHLGVPRVWLDAGRLVEVPEQPQSYQYLHTELGFAAAMLFGGPIGARLLSLGLVGVACAGLLGWSRTVIGARWAGAATLLYASTPVIAWEATTTSVDAVVATYVLLALTAAHRATVGSDRPWAVLAGASAGAAVATKLTALTAVVPLILLVWALTRGRRSIATTVCLVTAALVLPWAVLSYARTGNPVFPLLDTIFRSPVYPPLELARDLDRFGLGRDPLALVRVPFAVSFDAQTFTEAMRGPVVGLGLLALPLAVPALRRSAELRYLAAFSLMGFLAWALSAQQIRYLAPVLPPLAILTAAGLRDLAETLGGTLRRVAHALPAVIALAGLPLYLGTLWNVPDGIPVGIAAGAETPAAYLTRTLPTYGAFAALAERPGAKSTRVVLLSKDGGRGDDEDRLYAPGAVETHSSWRSADLFTSPDEDVALARLRAIGATHVLVDRDGLHGTLARAAISKEAFLQRIGRVVYASGPVVLYELDLR